MKISVDIKKQKNGYNMKIFWKCRKNKRKKVVKQEMVEILYVCGYQ